MPKPKVKSKSKKKLKSSSLKSKRKLKTKKVTPKRKLKSKLKTKAKLKKMAKTKGVAKKKARAKTKTKTKARVKTKARAKYKATTKGKIRKSAKAKSKLKTKTKAKTQVTLKKKLILTEEQKTTFLEVIKRILDIRKTTIDGLKSLDAIDQILNPYNQKYTDTYGKFDAIINFAMIEHAQYISDTSLIAFKDTGKDSMALYALLAKIGNGEIQFSDALEQMNLIYEDSLKEKSEAKDTLA